jgi:hypothetical protein
MRLSDLDHNSYKDDIGVGQLDYGSSHTLDGM